MIEADFIQNLVRESLRGIKPYATARDEFKGEASIFLDANENSLGSPAGDGMNRYPDPYQLALKQAISKIKGVPPQNIFLGNGSDEAIDLLFRIFCEPGKHNAVVCPPTYGMYEVSAAINNVEVRKAVLDDAFDLDIETIQKLIDKNTRLIFVCSPNNPTGNAMTRIKIETLLNGFNGLVVIDEAYGNYSRHRSFIPELTEYTNLVVMQTFSKAWGMAGIRLGMAFACEDIISWFNKIKPPYNVNELTQQTALQALPKVNEVNTWIKEIVDERKKLAQTLPGLSGVLKVYESEANFLLVKFKNATEVFNQLLKSGIVVRDRSNAVKCEGCLRITIGTVEENKVMISELKQILA
ncbi:MAG: histidinol-phosphate transaminase [Flavobacteriales bacterium]